MGKDKPELTGATLRKIRHYLFLFLVCAFCSNVFAGQNDIITNALVYRVRYRIDIQNANQPALDYSLKFPLFSTQDLPPYQKLVSLKVNSPAAPIQVVNNLTGKLSLPILKPGQRIHSEITYTFANYAIDYPLSTLEANDDITVNSDYLREESAIESNSSQIVKLAQQVTDGAATQLDKAKRLFAYVNSNLQYTQGDNTHSALQTLRQGGGSCEDFSLLYIALCRAVGIPARYVSGYRFSPGEVGWREMDLDPFAHAWAEINLAGTGWVTVEPTYVYTVNNVKKVNYDFFGRILDDDRHLFFSYSRQQERTVTWNYESGHPPKVTTDFHIFITEE
jgi:Transglutaminase-like enzymes, putative cysteine proteases